jgi:hypothetical protein
MGGGATVVVVDGATVVAGRLVVVVVVDGATVVAGRLVVVVVVDGATVVAGGLVVVVVVDGATVVAGGLVVVVVGATVVVVVGATGLTAVDGADRAPMPAAFQADTWNSYEMVGSSPIARWEVNVDDVLETRTAHSPPSTRRSIR